MKTLINLEEISKFVLAYTLSLYIGSDWWLFWVWLFVPDLSMLAYLISSRTGAWFYNIFHHQGVAIAIGLTGLYFHAEALQLAGLVLFGHSAMDRALGYGLKYKDGFKHTHLGYIGKPKGSS